MNEILKMIKALKKQGFALAEEKEKLFSKMAELDSDDAEILEDDKKEVEKLPEEDPKIKEENDKADSDVEKGIKNLFDREGKRIENSLKTEIKTWLDEQKELSEQKAGVYNPDAQEKRKSLNNYLRELAKTLLSKDDTKLKEMTTDATGTPYGGYTVDSELSAEIRHLVTKYGVARREMNTIQLSKNSYKANNLVTDLSVFWTDEGSVINSTQVVLGQKTLELQKLSAIVTLTSELLDDTEIDFISFIASRVAEGFAEAEDEAFFNGDGTSAYGSFTGLLAVAGTNEVTMTGSTFASMDADDLIDMIDATPSGALEGAKFMYHRSIKSIIRKLKDDNGMYLYQAPSQSGPATVWGYPEVLVEVMPAIGDDAVDTSFVLFGNLRKACILGYKGGINAEMFNSGSVRNVADSADINLITTDRKAIRWTERVGYIAILPNAVTKLTTASASA